MQKFIVRLFSVLMLVSGLNMVLIKPALAGYCDTYDLTTGADILAAGRAGSMELGKSLSLAYYATLTGYSSLLNVKLGCALGGETLQYRNGIEGGYTVKFTTGDQDTYIKFTASMPITSKDFSSFINHDYSASEFNTEITLNAELADTTGFDNVSTDGSAEIPVLYMISTEGSGIYPTASSLRNLLPNRAAAATSGHHHLKAFSSFDVNFVPVNTTCQIGNQQFSLPSTTLFALKSGDHSDTRFNIQLSCSGSLGSKATKTFNLRTYSNDIVDSANYIVRNSSSTSAGIGFQLFNTLADPLKFSTGYDAASTSLASMTQGKDFVSSLTSIDIGARYKIFDGAKASPGTVVGTVIIYMEYE